MHQQLICANCGLEHPLDRLQNLCTACQRPLVARYDLAALRSTFTPGVVRQRADRSLWRFHEVLPVDATRSTRS